MCTRRVLAKSEAWHFLCALRRALDGPSLIKRRVSAQQKLTDACSTILLSRISKGPFLWTGNLTRDPSGELGGRFIDERDFETLREEAAARLTRKQRQSSLKDMTKDQKVYFDSLCRVLRLDRAQSEVLQKGSRNFIAFFPGIETHLDSIVK